MKEGEVVFSFIKNILKKQDQSNKISSMDSKLEKLKQIDMFNNVFLKYSYEHNIMSYLAFFKFSDSSRVDVDYLQKITGMHIREKEESYDGFKITVSADQYKRYVESLNKLDYMKMVDSLYTNFKNMSFEDKLEFTDSFYETIVKLEQFVNETCSDKVDVDDYKLIISTLKLINNHNIDVKSENINQLRNDIKFEIEYLKKINSLI